MTTWTPKVCKIMAPRAILKGLGLLFYILLGFNLGYFGTDLENAAGNDIGTYIARALNSFVYGVDNCGPKSGGKNSYKHAVGSNYRRGLPNGREVVQGVCIRCTPTQ